MAWKTLAATDLPPTRMEAARNTLDGLRADRDKLGPPSPTTAPSAAGAGQDTGHYDDGHSFGWKKPEPAAPPEQTKTSFNWKVAAGAGLAVALIAVVAIVALAGGGSSSKGEPVAATDSSTADDAVPSTAVAAAGAPIRYQSNCQGACFMKVDAATCDRVFHFDLTILGDDVAKFEGKTAVISTLGPGLEPTYDVPVAGGKVVLDATATGASYGGDPKRGCGVNGATLQWSGFLTSVDGQPTITPNPPQAAN